MFHTISANVIVLYKCSSRIVIMVGNLCDHIACLLVNFISAQLELYLHEKFTLDANKCKEKAIVYRLSDQRIERK